jgi:hypothetical protein
MLGNLFPLSGTYSQTAVPIWRRLDWQAVVSAFARTFWRKGEIMPANMAMMVMTVRSSTKVKAFLRRSARSMEGLAALLGGAAFDVPLVALGSLFRAHFAHGTRESLARTFGPCGIVHNFLPFLVSLPLCG